MSTALSNDQEIKKFINANNDYYEKCLLTSIIHSSYFWFNRCKDNLNVNKSKYDAYKDFSKPIDNNIYNTISFLYSSLNLNNTSSNDICLSTSMLLGAFRADPSSKLLENQDYFKSIESRLKELEETDKDVINTLLNIADTCFDYWLETRRSKQITYNAISKATSISDLLETLNKEQDRLIKKKSDDTKSITSILESYNTEEADDSAERISFLSLPQLTSIMGGGIKKQETMLIIAPPGGGKTTISCQLAANIAENDKKVVYITTEQPGSELLPKMISFGASIDYMKIRDGFKTSYLNEGTYFNDIEKTRIKNFINKIKSNLWFEDWCSSGSKIKAQLKNTIEQHIKNHGVDVVFIDWIGGGVDMEASDGDLKRFFLDECCRIIKDIAIQYNIAIIACSQASASKSEDVSFITAREIAENTQLHTYFTWALGISALGVNKKSKLADKGMIHGTVDNRKEIQFFNLFKTRKSAGKAYAVRTEFNVSRFVEINEAVASNAVQEASKNEGADTPVELTENMTLK